MWDYRKTLSKTECFIQMILWALTLVLTVWAGWKWAGWKIFSTDQKDLFLFLLLLGVQLAGFLMAFWRWSRHDKKAEKK